MTHVSTNRVSFRITIAVLLALLLAWLGQQAIESAHQFDETPPGGFNLFATPTSHFTAQKTLKNAMDQLEVRVWSKERSELIDRLEGLLHAQINQTPFDARLWQALADVQAESAPDIEDRAWTLAQAWKFNNWNHAERFNITHHCVDDYERLTSIAPRLCSNMIRSVPVTSNEQVLAGFLGISHGRLKQVLAAEALSYEVLNQ